jgi:hypothetical protein
MIEGTTCAVALFADASHGLVLSTLGAVASPAILTATHTADPDAHRTLYTYSDWAGSYTLTTSWAAIPDLSIALAPPSPHTWTTIVTAQVILRATGTAEVTDLYAQIARDGVLVGASNLATVSATYQSVTIPLAYLDSVVYTTPRTYTVQAKKSGGTQAKAATISQMLIMALRSA